INSDTIIQIPKCVSRNQTDGTAICPNLYQYYNGNECVCYPNFPSSVCHTCGALGNCNSHGTCQDATGSGNSFCTCEDGYIGDNCEIQPVRDECVVGGDRTTCELRFWS